MKSSAPAYAIPGLDEALARAEQARVTAGQQIAVALRQMRCPSTIRILQALDHAPDAMTARALSEQFGLKFHYRPNGVTVVSPSVTTSLRWLVDCGLLQRWPGLRQYTYGPVPFLYDLTNLGRATVTQIMTTTGHAADGGEPLLVDTIARYRMDLSTTGWRIYELLRKGHWLRCLRIMSILGRTASWCSAKDITTALGLRVRDNAIPYETLSWLTVQRFLRTTGSPVRYRLTDLGAAVSRHAQLAAEAHGQPVVRGPTPRDYRELVPPPVMEENHA